MIKYNVQRWRFYSQIFISDLEAVYLFTETLLWILWVRPSLMELSFFNSNSHPEITQNTFRKFCKNLRELRNLRCISMSFTSYRLKMNLWKNKIDRLTWVTDETFNCLGKFLSSLVELKRIEIDFVKSRIKEKTFLISNLDVGIFQTLDWLDLTKDWEGWVLWSKLC